MAEILTYAQWLTNGRDAIGSAEKFANAAAGYSTPTNLETASNIVTATGILAAAVGGVEKNPVVKTIANLVGTGVGGWGVIDSIAKIDQARVDYENSGANDAARDKALRDMIDTGAAVAWQNSLVLVTIVHSGTESS